MTPGKNIAYARNLNVRSFNALTHTAVTANTKAAKGKHIFHFVVLRRLYSDLERST